MISVSSSNYFLTPRPHLLQACNYLMSIVGGVVHTGRRTSGSVFWPHFMPPPHEPVVDQWAYDHDDIGGIKYRWHWDRSRGSVTRRGHGATGWIICTATYAGDVQFELPARLSRPVRVHNCSSYPCQARWVHGPYRKDAPPQPSVHFLDAEAPAVLRGQSLATAPAALPPSSSSSATA